MKTFICGSLFEDVSLSGVGLAILLTMLAIVLILTVAVNVVPIIAHKWEIKYGTRDLTYGAACLALAFALSWAGVTLPNGGTITVASLVPIFLYCYYFGLRKGMVITTAYMLLQFLQYPNIVSPWSAFFDYILPYFALCVVGLFRYKPQKYGAFLKKNGNSRNGFKKWGYTVAGHWGIFVGAVVHALIRYFCQTVSGVMNYELWYGAGFSFTFKLTFSLTYNSYGLIDTAISLFAMLILLSSRSFNMFMTANFDDKKALRAAVGGSGAATETNGVGDTAAEANGVVGVENRDDGSDVRTADGSGMSAASE